MQVFCKQCCNFKSDTEFKRAQYDTENMKWIAITVEICMTCQVEGPDGHTEDIV